MFKNPALTVGCGIIEVGSHAESLPHCTAPTAENIAHGFFKNPVLIAECGIIEVDTMYQIEDNCLYPYPIGSAYALSVGFFMRTRMASHDNHYDFQY